MSLREVFRVFFCFLFVVLAARAAQVQSLAQSSSSSSTKSRLVRKGASGDATPDPGTLSKGAYHNAGFGFTCKIPPGWVLRTEQMNVHDDEPKAESGPAGAASGKTGR